MTFIWGLIARVGLSKIGWKPILAGLFALIIVSAVTGGYLYVNNLQEKLTKVSLELTLEEVRRKTAEEAIISLTANIEKQKRLSEKLEGKIKILDAEWNVQLDEIEKIRNQEYSEMILEKENANEFVPKTDKAQNIKTNSDYGDLNDRNAAINRMLERNKGN